MINLKINNKDIEVESGTYLLDAAKKEGIDIPAMCYNQEAGRFTSCMVCMVKNQATGQLLPSCSVKCEEGMDVVTDDEEIHESRKVALELLLSEHVGDCEAPCTIACPAQMNIPLMNRLLVQEKFDETLNIVRKDIALPAVLGRICPAPCEGACKRKPIDESVSICLLKRYAGDYGKDAPIPSMKPKGKSIAIIGSGPAGLAAGYYLQLKGYGCEIFDRNPLPGGELRYSISDENLPKEVLDKEIGYIKSTGVKVSLNKEIDQEEFKKLTNNYDAIIIATGNFNKSISSWGIEHDNNVIKVNKDSYETNVKGVFAIGNVIRSSKYAIRSLAHGKEVTASVDQFLNNKLVTGYFKRFNSKFGKLVKEEYQEYLKESIERERIEPINESSGFSKEDVVKEAERCLRCDCRKTDNCLLRDYSEEYSAVQRRFKYDDRKNIKKKFIQNTIVYEPGKCIKCGICVRLTAKHQEKFGFTFIGRGFDVEIGIPFNQDLENALNQTAELVASACPTGALAKK